jgi:hypothetical protein
MSTDRRSTLIATIALIAAAAVWAATLPHLVSVSTATWATLAIAVFATVALKFRKHAELPDSVRLH